MFRNREAHEFGQGYDVPADYHLSNLNFTVKNLGKMFASTKKSYHWTFNVRAPGTDREFSPVTVTLTDSTLSNKKTLEVNGKKLLDKEKILNFGKPAYQLHQGCFQQIPMSICLSTKGDSQDFDLMVAGSLFSDLLKQWLVCRKQMKKFLDLYVPITDHDENCDFSTISGVTQARFKDRIEQAAQKAQQAAKQAAMEEDKQKESQMEQKDKKISKPTVSHQSADVKGVEQIRAELEMLTFERISGVPIEFQSQQMKTSEVNQLSVPAPTANTGEDLRKTVSQNYTSDFLGDVTNRASTVSASTQETADKAATQAQLERQFADLFYSGPLSTNSAQAQVNPATVAVQAQQSCPSTTGQNPFANSNVHVPQKIGHFLTGPQPHHADVFSSNSGSQGCFNTAMPQQHMAAPFTHSRTSVCGAPNPFDLVMQGSGSGRSSMKRPEQHDFLVSEPFSKKNVDQHMKQLAEELNQYSTGAAQKQQLHSVKKIVPQTTKATDPFSFFD